MTTGLPVSADWSSVVIALLNNSPTILFFSTESPASLGVVVVAAAVVAAPADSQSYLSSPRSLLFRTSKYKSLRHAFLPLRRCRLPCMLGTGPEVLFCCSPACFFRFEPTRIVIAVAVAVAVAWFFRFEPTRVVDMYRCCCCCCCLLLLLHAGVLVRGLRHLGLVL